VVLTPRLFVRPSNGGELATARLLSNLVAAGHQVFCLGRGDAAAAAVGGVQQVSVGPAEPAFAELALAGRAARLARALAGGQSVMAQRLGASGAARCVQAWLRHNAPVALVVNHLASFTWLEGSLPRSGPLLLVMHNLDADGYQEQAQQNTAKAPGARLRRALLLRESRRVRQLEDHAFVSACAIACLSDVDAERLRKRAAALGVRTPVLLLPSYPMITPIPLTPAKATTSGSRRRIGLIGTWTWEPNRVALQWMLEHVSPMLAPNCELVLAGRGLDWVQPRVGVYLMGAVSDATSFYQAVDIVAVPSLIGSGVQEKAVEAIGSGRTVVATPHALRGLGGAALPAHVHVAGSAAEFARLCTEAQPASAESAAEVEEGWVRHRQAAYRMALERALSSNA
jgi:polysaccharide biosynthesis protein PslH